MQREISLIFYGYSWERYIQYVSTAKGIFLLYAGKLDNEGSVEVTQLLHITSLTNAESLYTENVLDNVKTATGYKGDIFFSYANIDNKEEATVIASILKNEVKPPYDTNNKIEKQKGWKLYCSGSCAFIPEIIIT